MVYKIIKRDPRTGLQLMKWVYENNRKFHRYGHEIVLRHHKGIDWLDPKREMVLFDMELYYMDDNDEWVRDDMLLFPNIPEYYHERFPNY